MPGTGMSYMLHILLKSLACMISYDTSWDVSMIPSWWYRYHHAKYRSIYDTIWYICIFSRNGIRRMRDTIWYSGQVGSGLLLLVRRAVYAASGTPLGHNHKENFSINMNTKRSLYFWPIVLHEKRRWYEILRSMRQRMRCGTYLLVYNVLLIDV